MGKAAVYTWAASDVAAVCAIQTTSGAANLLLNGTLAEGNSYPPPTVISFGNVQRCVSLTSIANNSGVNVTITGTLNGAVQTITHAGPNNNTVSLPDELFDTVTSVSVSGAVTGMSVGSGTTGQTRPFLYDYYAPYAALTVSIEVTGTVSYFFAATLDDVATNPDPFSFDGIIAPNPGNVNAYQYLMGTPDGEGGVTPATTSAIANINYPIRYCWITVGSTTGSFVATIIQQGIK